MRRPIPSEECARAREWVSLRLDSQLSAFEEVLLEAHLARCVDCLAFAESMTDLTKALRTVPLEAPPFAFEVPRRGRTRVHGLRAVSAAAVAAAVGLTGLVGLQLSATRTTPGTEARTERALIGLKAELLEPMDGAAPTRSGVRPSLAAAERMTVGVKTAVRGQLPGGFHRRASAQNEGR
jgi:predicted anti-sigma-YlaC factor YlaD